MHLLPFFSVILLACVTSSKCKIIDKNNPAWVLQKFFNQCAQKEELVKCLKIQALKVTERAIQIKSFDVVDGLSIVGNSKQGKSVGGLYFNDSTLEKLSQDDLDSLLGDKASSFLDTHKIEVNLPKLVEVTGRSLTEETRRRKGGGGGGGGGKGKGGGYGALLAALAIKGSFLAMAYKGIAIMSGTAIIIGKMALVLTAILGLKKLVSGNHEKTTFEIIKTPKFTEDHIHSSTYEDDHHDHYRRNYLDTGEVQKRIYRFRIPEH